jgi:hypothetical protein
VNASPDMLKAAHQYMSDKFNTDLSSDDVPPPIPFFSRSARAVVQSDGVAVDSMLSATVPPLEFSSLRQTSSNSWATAVNASASLHKFPSPLPASRRESSVGEPFLNAVKGDVGGGDQSGDAAFAAAVAAAAAAATATSNEGYSSRNRFNRSPGASLGGSSGGSVNSSSDGTPVKYNNNNNTLSPSHLVLDTTTTTTTAATATAVSSLTTSSASSSASSSLMTVRSHSPSAASASALASASSDNNEKIKRLESDIAQFLDLAAKTAGVRRAPRRDRGNLTDLLSDASTAMNLLASS